MASFETKLNRRRLTGAYNDKCELVWVASAPEEAEFAIFSTNGRALLVNSALIPEKATKSTQGVSVMSLRKGQTVQEVKAASVLLPQAQHRYRAKNLPAAGALLRDTDTADGAQRE